MASSGENQNLFDANTRTNINLNNCVVIVNTSNNNNATGSGSNTESQKLISLNSNSNAEECQKLLANAFNEAATAVATTAAAYQTSTQHSTAAADLAETDNIVVDIVYDDNDDDDANDCCCAASIEGAAKLTQAQQHEHNNHQPYVGCNLCSSNFSTSCASNLASTCPAYDYNSSISTCFDDAATGCHAVVIRQHPELLDSDAEELADGALRYSFKGFPPELYSPKKEFIYTRPLVEKQLVLKKTCEWWFYKNKCRNMSTHWKQNAFLFIAAGILLLLGLIIYLCLPIGGGGGSMKNVTELIAINAATPATIANITTVTLTTTTMTTTTMSTARYPYDVPEIETQHSFVDDENFSNEDDDIDSDIEDINNSIPDEFTVDFVNPKKVHNFSLNADDLLYESKRNHTTNNKDSAFSVTGTFRSKSSQIWDPHPEYILNTFGHQLHLILDQDTSFIPPKTFRVLRILNNRTEEEDNEEVHYLGCYYKGYVEGHEQSAVAVSLCHGMTGYIKTSFGSLLIQPVNQTNDDAEILHKVWRHSRRNARHAVSGNLDMDFQVIEQLLYNNDNNNIVWQSNMTAESLIQPQLLPQPQLLRKKRNYEDRHLFTLEVLVAADRTMIEFHKDDLKSYILTLISIVSNIFSDASIGNSIRISVANVLKVRDDISTTRSGRKRATSASQLLKHFCSFVSRQGYHYDTALLITRDQICRNERERCDTLGLAELGTVCKPTSCAIVQDNGLPAAFTIAHELGHILNMPHDDDDRCKQFNKPGTKRNLHIMSSIMGDDIHPWSWSDCSRYYVSEFLEKEDKPCLEDTPTTYIANYNTKLPGEIYSLDHQCQLIHGNQSKNCHIDGECKRLWCRAEDNHSDCRSSNLPWADGTPCNKERYWCQKGQCVSRDGNQLQVVNGGWGAWSAFTPCSLTCGGGVQESQRECNNPLPKNGGKYCAGSRKKYRSCNTHSCPTDSLDSREQQCYDMNGRNLGIKGIDRSAKWVPKYGLSSNDKCKLYCRLEDNSAYFRLSEKVKDGTTCSVDSFDKCVNGICRPAGCDNELNSIAKLDKCGICEGRNDTCEEFTANFYVSDLYKIQPKSNSYYYYVTTIPKGSSNIVITQPGYSTENYIVLRDDQNNSILNGNKLISTYRNISFYAGVTFEYNGSNSTVERVNTTYSRKLKRDLVVEIISLSTNAAKNDSLLLTYTYTLDKQNYVEPEVEIYRWEMQPWSNCDALCQGSSYRVPVCVSTSMVLKVAPQFCDETAKPRTEYRTCNTDCELSFKVASISECSASCGMLGTREKIYYCIQKFPEMGRTNIVDLTYCASKFELPRQESCREGCWNYTEWSLCSKSCGTGTQSRSMACFLNQSRVDDSLCNPRKKNPQDMLRICNVEPCRYYEENAKSSRSIVSHWQTSDWGECNDRCEKNRTVVCRNQHGYNCPLDRKPITKRKCCNIKYVSNWSNCSVECGNGHRYKELHCARVYKPDIKGTPRRRVFIDSSYCKHLRKPTPKRTQKPCKVSCKWSASDWTQCPSDCSEEYQSRSVYCESVMGNPITYKYCDATKKPASKKICNNCVRRESKIISACNCDGYRRRRIVCYDSSHRRLPCPSKEKIIKEKCAAPADCHAQSCLDLRRRHQYYEDREYTVYIRSRPKKIYCHDMNNEPKEYITISPTENYSIYYHYKTSDPNKCPPESQQYEYQDNSISWGRTNFEKIRVNITDLRVIESDFTFSVTTGVPQPYASAGDCYNRNRKCPRGDFSINLERTGFHIRPGTVWDRHGNFVVMKTSNSFETSTTTRRALCGGYCGRCSISTHYGLYLDV